MYMSSFSNPDPRHSDLIEGAVTTELPRQPLWSNSNISYKVYLDIQAFALSHLGLGSTHSTVVATVAPVGRSPSMKSSFREFESRSGQLIFSGNFSA